MVTVRQNRYSVPVGLVGLRVLAEIGAREIKVSHDGKPVARHDRPGGTVRVAAELDHYLDLLVQSRVRWPARLRCISSVSGCLAGLL